MKKEHYDSAHKRSISKLIDEFGSDHKDEISKIYNHEREIMENDCRENLKQFIPIFSYKITKQILKAEYKPGYLEKKIKKIEEKLK